MHWTLKLLFFALAVWIIGKILVGVLLFLAILLQNINIEPLPKDKSFWSVLWDGFLSIYDKDWIPQWARYPLAVIGAVGVLGILFDVTRWVLKKTGVIKPEPEKDDGLLKKYHSRG